MTRVFFLLFVSHNFDDQFSSNFQRFIIFKFNAYYVEIHQGRQLGPIFMALLIVSTESALTEAGNSVLTASVFHGLVANFGFSACVLPVTRHSALTRRAQKFGACT